MNSLHNQMNLDRFQGAMLGLAIGDAMGTPAEFQERGTFEEIRSFQYCENFDLQPGEWTDDTSMALCLAQSLIDKNGFDAYDQMEKYVKWFLDGYMSHNGKAFDIGETVLQSLSMFIKTKEPYTYLTAEHYSGNGSLMRLAPVVLFYSENINKAVHYAGESSKTTHGSPIAIDACRYFAYLLVKILEGQTKNEPFSKNGIESMNQFFTDNPLHNEIKAIAQGSFINKNVDMILSSGYVAHTLEAALWSFYHTESFKDAVLKAVNLGYDADTVGAVTGQIAGVFYGVFHIPKSWKNNLAWHNTISKMTRKLGV